MVKPADINRKGEERYARTFKFDAQLTSWKHKEGRLKRIIVPEKESREVSTPPTTYKS